MFEPNLSLRSGSIGGTPSGFGGGAAPVETPKLDNSGGGILESGGGARPGDGGRAAPIEKPKVDLSGGGARPGDGGKAAPIEKPKVDNSEKFTEKPEPVKPKGETKDSEISITGFDDSNKMPPRVKSGAQEETGVIDKPQKGVNLRDDIGGDFNPAGNVEKKAEKKVEFSKSNKDMSNPDFGSVIDGAVDVVDEVTKSPQYLNDAADQFERWSSDLNDKFLEIANKVNSGKDEAAETVKKNIVQNELQNTKNKVLNWLEKPANLGIAGAALLVIFIIFKS